MKILLSAIPFDNGKSGIFRLYKRGCEGVGKCRA